MQDKFLLIYTSKIVIQNKIIWLFFFKIMIFTKLLPFFQHRFSGTLCWTGYNACWYYQIWTKYQTSIKHELNLSWNQMFSSVCSLKELPCPLLTLVHAAKLHWCLLKAPVCFTILIMNNLSFFLFKNKYSTKVGNSIFLN